MKLLGEFIGDIILSPNEKKYPLYDASKVDDIDSLSDCFFLAHEPDKTVVYKKTSIGTLKLKGNYDETTLATNDHLTHFLETTGSQSNFVRTDNAIFYVHQHNHGTHACTRFKINEASIRDFERRIRPSRARLLSTNEVLQIKKKYCPEINLDLYAYRIGDFKELATIEGTRTSTSITQTDLEVLGLKRRIPAKYEINHSYVETNDRVKLATLTIEKAQTKTDLSLKQYIIYFSARGQGFADFSDMIKDAEAGFSVISFCYRNQDKKYRAKSKQDILQDGIAQVQALLDKGVAPENINLSGASVGGAIAIEVAAYFNRKQLKIGVFADRTFASIQALINAYVIAFAQTLLNPLSASFYADTSFLFIVAKTIFWPLTFVVIVIAYLITSLLIQISDWNFNPASVIKDIPLKNREYFVAKTPKCSQLAKKTIKPIIDDEVILYAASLYKCSYLQNERRQQKKNVSLPNHAENKYRKLYVKEEASQYGTHCTCLSELENVMGEKGHDIRLKFFKRYLEPTTDDSNSNTVDNAIITQVKL